MGRKMRMMKRKHKAQSLVEYTMILGVIALAIMSMQVYFKRGIQSLIKVVADDYGPYGAQGQGEAVGAIEQAVKQEVFVGEGKVPTAATTNSTFTQRAINTGNSTIRSEMSGSTITTTDSYAIGGDYRKKQ
jgi:Flp pilus assembly pilin Flp